VEGLLRKHVKGNSNSNGGYVRVSAPGPAALRAEARGGLHGMATAGALQGYHSGCLRAN
jgi:hypothetical protein